MRNVFGIFNFVDSVKKSIVEVYNLINDTSEAPRLSLNLNHRYLNGSVDVIDLSWYAPYKDFGDGVICAFMYLGFMWHVFKNLYNIVSGEDSFSSKGTEISE